MPRVTTILPAPIRTRLRHGLRRRLPLRTVWTRALPTEVAFWDKIMATGGLNWPWAYERGLDPDSEVTDPLLIERLDEPQIRAAENVSVLDVGAGPLSCVGRHHAGRTLDTTATDALGDEYDKLLARYELDPPVRTRQVPGEELLSTFGRERFDIAYSRNALDHSADPLEVIRQMLAVVKPDGVVILRHYQNEGASMSYEELHQWNFDIRDERLVLWNERATIDVMNELAGVAQLDSLAATPAPWSERPWIAVRLSPLRA